MYKKMSDRDLVLEFVETEKLKLLTYDAYINADEAAELVKTELKNRHELMEIIQINGVITKGKDVIMCSGNSVWLSDSQRYASIESLNSEVPEDE